MSEPHHVSAHVKEALAMCGIVDEQCNKDFIEEVFELCFGEDGINRGFSMDEALKKIREFSDKALVFELSHEGSAAHTLYRDLDTIQPTFTVGEDGEPMI